MKKTLEITLDQAKEILKTTPSLSEVIYSNFPELKPKPIILNSWVDLEYIKGFYLSTNSSIIKMTVPEVTVNNNRNIFYNEKQAKSSLAYAQLTQLMANTGDCFVDWNSNEIKYTVICDKDKIKRNEAVNYFNFLAFNTKLIRDEFMEKHSDLIKEFYQID